MVGVLGTSIGAGRSEEIRRSASMLHLARFLFFQTEFNGTIMKKKPITFMTKVPSNNSKLGFVQPQVHTKSKDRNITVDRRITDRFIGGVSSNHFSILACICPSSMICTPCLTIAKQIERGVDHPRRRLLILFIGLIVQGHRHFVFLGFLRLRSIPQLLRP